MRSTKSGNLKHVRTTTVEASSCVLGIDLGTSALKLVALAHDGRVLASARESYPTISRSEGQAEQDCEHWLQALWVASTKVRSRLRQKARIEAVALTGQMPTLVVLGRRKPIAHAIAWQDSRADRSVSTRVDQHLRREIYLKTGILIDGRYLAPMYQFHHAAKRRRASLILSAKDFLFHALTGLAATDPSTASGYGLYNLHTKAWDPGLSMFWGVPAENLPSLKSSSFRAPLSKRGSKLLGCASGTPVVLGCADSVAGVYALGGTNDLAHTAAVLTGTSTVIMKCDSQPRWDPRCRYLLTPFAVDGWYGCEADLLATGSAREWAAKVFLCRGNKKTRRTLWQSAYEIAPGADGLLFAPYLAGGEQGVLWNPTLRGNLTGLTLDHDGAKVARALIEGTCFEIRRCLEVLEGDAPLSSLRVAGWAAEIPEELQLLADITGHPIHAFALGSASAIGAALVSDVIDSAKYFAKRKALVLNPGEQSQSYNEIYARYIATFSATDARSLSTP
jgi:xylulokinase